MPRYAVVYVATADATVEVEAEDMDDAMDKADQEFQFPQQCYHCAMNFNLGDWYPDDSPNGVYEID